METRQTATAEALRQNQERFDDLEALVRQLQDTIQNGPRRPVSEREESPPSVSSTFNVPDIPDTKVPLPDPFSGKSAEYASFMAQCTLLFSARPREYVKDERKILLVISRLRGAPLSWAQKVATDPNHPLRNDWNAFKTALDRIYEDRNSKWKRSHRLLHLQQTGSAEAYAAEFQSLAATLSINDEGLCPIFYRGLKSSVKDALASVPLSWILTELIDQAVGADQRVHQREVEERKANPKPKEKRFYNPSESSSSNKSKPQYGNNERRNETSNREHRYQPLPDAEKKRRRENNLCLFCGDSDHAASNCPRAPKRPKKFSETSNASRSVNSLVTTIEPSPPTSSGKV